MIQDALMDYRSSHSWSFSLEHINMILKQCQERMGVDALSLIETRKESFYVNQPQYNAIATMKTTPKNAFASPNIDDKSSVNLSDLSN